jgi:acetyl esterase/lipase
VSRRARAVASVDSIPQAAPSRTRFYRDTIFRRVRSGAATAFFGGLSSLARLHPASNPKRHGIEVEHDIIYGPHGDWNTLDIYRPVMRPKPWPVVFYVHGGAFHLLSKDTHWLMGLVFARFGYLVVNISYRLAPKHPYPAAIEDTCAAYRWLADNIHELGGDPNRVAVAGESAGGNLITALTLAASQPRPEAWAREVYETVSCRAQRCRSARSSRSRTQADSQSANPASRDGSTACCAMPPPRTCTAIRTSRATRPRSPIRCA